MAGPLEAAAVHALHVVDAGEAVLARAAVQPSATLALAAPTSLEEESKLLQS